MRNPLIGLLVAATTFFFGAAVQNLSQPEQVYVFENIKFAPQIDFKRNYPTSNEVVEKKMAENPFSIIEGDYFSAEEAQISMFLYSYADESERLIVEGRIRIDSKIYEINSRNQNRFDSAKAEIKFQTEKVKDVQYKFNGKFSKKEYQDGETVLSGKLQKFIKGKMVKEAEGQYIFYFHKCSQ